MRQGDVHAHQQRTLFRRAQAPRLGITDDPSRGSYLHDSALHGPDGRSHPLSVSGIRATPTFDSHAPSSWQVTAPHCLLHTQPAGALRVLTARESIRSVRSLERGSTHSGPARLCRAVLRCVRNVRADRTRERDLVRAWLVPAALTAAEQESEHAALPTMQRALPTRSHHGPETDLPFLQAEGNAPTAAPAHLAIGRIFIAPSTVTARTASALR